MKTVDVCWLPLFSQAVLAWGYPVPSQRDGLIGLEIDLEVLSALSGARHAVIFRGGLLLKGLAVILVPTKRCSNTIQWHLVTNDDDCRLTCEDAVHRAGQRILCDQLDLESYSRCRHIVGWCSKIKVMLGTSDFDYGSVSYSGTENATNMVRSAGKMALGIQQIVAAQVEFSVGKRVGKYAFRRQGSYERILKIASKTPIVLFDTGLRRGWLTPALAVMLHVVQLAIHSNPPESDKNKPLAFKGTALQTLLDHRDKCPVTGDSLADEISTIWNFIDYMIEVNVHEDTAVEQPVRGTLREVLYGFELMDLTEQTSPVHRKKLYVRNTHGGWPALVRDIDALVLFGNGFGDIMLPIEPSLCPTWATMPQGHDFLASTVETLVELYKKAGSQDWKYLTTQKLQWHRGTSALFEPCEFHASCCTCDRLQRIVPNEAVGHVTGPGPLDTQGAVIFGQLGRPSGLNNLQNALRESFGLQKPQDTNEPPHRAISGLIPGYRRFSRRRNMELN
ncbi:hypothetical protein BJ166DRAFT_259439 [Pestalotiopsis sp. NC0098]|nr:hypothetical protein BJ166DRAFT_259439 [Pestalotiopsis sp. NC0098]